MARLRDFVVPIEGDTSGFSTAMRKAADTASREARRIETALEGVNGLLAGLGAGISIAGITAGIKAAIDYGDNLRDLAKATGSTVEELAALDFMAKKSGASIETVARATGVFQRQLGEVLAGGAKKTAAAIEALGLSAEQLASTSLTEQLAAIAGQLEQVGKPAERAAIGNAIFGRSFQQLLPLLAEGEKGFRNLKEEYLELTGNAISGAAAERFDKFNDQLVDLETASRAAFVQLSSGLVPTLTDFLVLVSRAPAASSNWLTDVFTDIASGAKFASAALDTLDATVSGTLARIFKGTEFGERKAKQAEEALRNAERVSEEARLLSEFEEPVRPVAPVLDRKPVRPGLAKLDLRTGDGGAAAAREREAREAERQRARLMAELERESQEVRNYFQDVARAREEAFARSQEALAREAQAAFNATRTPLERYTIEVKRLLSLGLDQDTLSRAIGQARDELDRAREKTLDTSSALADLGITFSSAFEDAVVSGGKLRDVLQGLQEDIARIALRSLVTEPLAKVTKDLFSAEGMASGAGGIGAGIKSFFSSIFGGARANGGPVAPGRAYLVGERGPELFMPSLSGQIVPSGGGGGVTIINNTGMAVNGRDRGNVGGRRVIELGVLDALSGAVGTGAASRDLGLAPGLVSR